MFWNNRKAPFFRGPLSNGQTRFRSSKLPGHATGDGAAQDEGATVAANGACVAYNALLVKGRMNKTSDPQEFTF